MKARIALTSSVALALVASAGLGLKASAGHHEATLRAMLRGLNEVPPNTSPATGTMRATLDETSQKMTFTVEYRNMTGNPTAAHIHFGQTKVAGGIIVFLCGGGGKPACPPSTSGTITGTITPADVVGPAAQGITPGDYAGLAYAIKSGAAYVNVHSDKFKEGEIRGQLTGPGISPRAEERAED